MTNYRIFIEGDGGEKLFLNYFIEYIQANNVGNTVDFVSVGGWTKLELLKSKLEENTDANGINIVVFDADDNIKDPTNGGFAARALKLQQILTSCSFKLFLYPNNNDDGDFESLLEVIANADHKVVLDCFSGYENCLSNCKNPETGDNKYNSPLRKSKIYAYVDAFPKSNQQRDKFKKGDFFFDNNYIWDLDNDNLLPLKNFLINVFNGII